MGSSISVRFGCLIFMVLYTVASSFAAVYTVGEGSGWALGVDYSGWTSDKTFVVGDTLGQLSSLISLLLLNSFFIIERDAIYISIIS